MAESPLVSITIVTFNSARFLGKCVESIRNQTYPNWELILVDNASSDETRSVLKPLETQHKIIYNNGNTGFAAAQNQAIAASAGSWVLVLNPDVILAPNFVECLIQHAGLLSDVGTACGKLLTLPPDLRIPPQPSIDSTGMFLTPQLRHLDRGSRQPDKGDYEKQEFVFGATGAAALYRREMIDHIAVDGEFFDIDFFAYREDADVSWRAQLLGWRCLYIPQAIAYHVRSVLPENRRGVPPILNMHSVKNRWLLRIKNMTGGLYRSYWLPITLRDLLVIGGCLTVEWSSLPAFSFLAKNWRRTWAKRRAIMQLRRASDDYLKQWVLPEGPRSTVR